MQVGIWLPHSVTSKGSEQVCLYFQRNSKSNGEKPGLTPGRQELVSVASTALGLGLVEGLVEIPEDIVEGLESNRDTHHIRSHPGGDLLFFAELSVRR